MVDGLDIGKSRRSQGAMEYLMTYGWAILIIAIVMVAIFQLHLFNPYTFSPKASTGSCQVIRPNGPRSNVFVSEIGEDCQTNEIPQYVAQFNGQNSYVAVPTTGLPLTGARSAFAWIYYTGPSSGTTTYYSIFSYGSNGPPPAVLSDLGVMLTSDANAGFGGWGDDFYSMPITPNTWTFVGYSYAGGASNTITIYANAQSLTTSLSTSLSTVLGTADIGQRGGPSGNWFLGSITNVQVYNTSLTQPQVTALYQEGIGGAPLDISNLVGWWPLNGNTNDYSGNNDNGNPVGVTFISNWENGYTAP